MPQTRKRLRTETLDCVFVPTTGRLLSALDELSGAQLTALKSGLDALRGALGLERRSAGMLFEG